MSNTTASPIGPEAPGDLPPRFRVEGEFAVRAVLRKLMTRRALVTLYPEGRIEDALVTRIVHVSQRGVEFDASDQPQSAAGLRGAGFTIGVAFPESIKTQFRLGRLRLPDERVRSMNAGASSAPLVTTLQAPVPTELYRVQRRESFRVRPPVDDDAHCVQKTGIGRELLHPIFDLSAGGVSLRLADGEAPPAPGRIWRQSRITTAGSLVIPCELVARGVYDGPPLAEGERRVGFAFHAMSSDALRRVQLYVLDIERRRRER